MDPTTKQRLKSILAQMSELDYIKPDSIPDISLYMDQVTTFMESELETCKRYPDDKILTRTMINNYAKNDLIPPPDKKKYNKEHLLLLIFIYYLKSFLSIGDIRKILMPLSDRYFGTDGNLDLSAIYERIYESEVGEASKVAKDLVVKYLRSKDTFDDLAATEEDKDVLQLFSFFCTLSFDIYVKKQIVERMIDLLPEVTAEKDRKTGKK